MDFNRIIHGNAEFCKGYFSGIPTFEILREHSDLYKNSAKYRILPTENAQNDSVENRFKLKLVILPDFC